MPSLLKAQELFPHSEPASTMPAGVIAARIQGDFFSDRVGRFRYYTGLRLFYGITSKLTVAVTGGMSNHHYRSLTDNFSRYLFNHHKSTIEPTDHLFEGIHWYLKYRVFSLDKEKNHFRIALYGEGSYSFANHIEAEPNLMNDNTGYGYGIIFTKLYKRFAASVTWGMYNVFPIYADNYGQKVKFKAGNMNHYSLSLGYRLFPHRYKNYNDVNVNVYSEFLVRDYDRSSISFDNTDLAYNKFKYTDNYTYLTLMGNMYIDAKISVQLILFSDTRIDTGITFPVYSRSYLHDYPLISFGITKYFFR